jgi:hypothetical protein
VIVVLQDVGLSHGEVPIENIENLRSIRPTSRLPNAPDHRAQAIVLDRPVVDILWIPRVESTVNVARGAMKSNTDFVASMSAPGRHAHRPILGTG